MNNIRILLFTIMSVCFLIVALFVGGAATGQDNKYDLQPQQYRFQQPPSLDIKPSYESNPCIK